MRGEVLVEMFLVVFKRVKLQLWRRDLKGSHLWITVSVLSFIDSQVLIAKG